MANPFSRFSAPTRADNPFAAFKQPSVSLGQSQPEESPSRNVGLIGDTADLLQKGLYEAVRGVGQFGESTIGVGEDLREWAKQRADAQLEELSPETLNAYNKEIISSKDGELWGEGAKDFRSWYAHTLEMVGLMGLPIPAGAAMTALVRAGMGINRAAKAFQATQAGRGLSFVQAKAQVLKNNKVKDWVSTTLGYGGAEAAVGAGATGAGKRQEILQTPIEQLSGIKAFQDYIQSGMSPEAAREALANDAADTTTYGATLPTMLLGAGAGRVYDNMLLGLGKSRTSNVLKGAATEALEEAPQSAAEQIAANYATQKHIDPDQPLTEGIGKSAIEGGIFGAILGGGVGGVMPVSPGEAPPPPPEPDPLVELDQAKTVEQATRAATRIAFDRDQPGPEAGPPMPTVEQINQRIIDERMAPGNVGTYPQAEGLLQRPVMPVQMPGEPDMGLMGAEPGWPGIVQPGPEAGPPTQELFKAAEPLPIAQPTPEPSPVTQPAEAVGTFKEYVESQGMSWEHAVELSKNDPQKYRSLMATYNTLKTPQEQPGIPAVEPGETPAPPKETQRERVARERRVVPETDNLLAAIAKSGGINIDEVAADLDIGDLKGAKGWKIKRPFHKGKKAESLDGMRELLDGHGYHYDSVDDLLGAIRLELTGTKQYSTAYSPPETAPVDDFLADLDDADEYSEEENQEMAEARSLYAKALDLDEAVANDIWESDKDNPTIIENLKALIDGREGTGREDTEGQGETEEVQPEGPGEAPGQPVQADEGQPGEGARDEGTDLLGQDTATAQAIADKAKEKEEKLSPKGERPAEAQTGDDLFAGGGQLEPDLFDEQPAPKGKPLKDIKLKEEIQIKTDDGTLEDATAYPDAEGLLADADSRISALEQLRECLTAS